MHHPRKRFGQNFLRDEAVVDRIISAIAPAPGQHVVEIGPGPGVLTGRLIAAGVDLQVVEIDRDLGAALPQRVPGLAPERVHVMDALKADILGLFPGADGDRKAIRVVGNLPYNISTPLLVRLFGYGCDISDMHFMLQKEVVARMAASPGGKAYGRLSVLCQLHCQVVPLFDVPPQAFEPAPKVDSTFVRLTTHERSPVQIRDRALFDRIVAAAFSQRRKTLRNSLKALLTPEMIEAAGVDPGLRAEALGLEEYAALAEVMANLHPPSANGI